MGAYTLKNRIVMAPLTRMRADDDLVPTDLNVEYYRQRSSAGLIITEATQISRLGQGYPTTPGIYSDRQVAGWKKVTDAVHQKDGRIFLQLWHVGRISHSSFHPEEGLPVAPSAIRPKGETSTSEWKQVPFETPRALETDEIKTLAHDYKQAAVNAKNAGFDGVELHSANGYLLNQLLHQAVFLITSFARSEFLACKTTRCFIAINCFAAKKPKPSEEPVININDILLCFNFGEVFLITKRTIFWLSCSIIVGKTAFYFTKSQRSHRIIGHFIGHSPGGCIADVCSYFINAVFNFSFNIIFCRNKTVKLT